MLYVLMKDSWVINGRLMHAIKWTLASIPIGGDRSLAIVWIALPFLLLVFFHERSLSSIASLVGRVIAIDEQTRSLSQVDIARVCLEVYILC